jgi:tryptophan 2,3-dioxygenase
VLGLKDAAVVQRLDCLPEERERLQKRLSEPSLMDAVDGLLRRRGLGGPEEDWRLKAFVRVYEEADDHADLNALAEVLIEMDECLALWRAHHIQMVERMIGAKRGTGGSAGVSYLASTLAKRAFPDLWTARTHIGEEPGA